eukprot:m.480339 g.480339  ORF g.480339 m.480339 type:complete len:781 (+) comp21794_c0_seq1:714-3056(+)
MNPYLILYNFVMVAGWAAILVGLVSRIHTSKSSTDLVPSWVPFGHGILYVHGSADDIYWLLQVFQTGAVLEIVHAVVGFVKSKPATVFKQVFSRVALVWAIIYMCPETLNLPEFTWMGLAWAITEVIRYSWYGLKDLLGAAPYPLTWCRYSFFIILYPVGVTGELCLNWAATKHLPFLLDNTSLKETDDGFSFLSKLNTAYQTFVILFMLAYIPVFPGLYLYMFGQRKKQLGAKKPAPRAPSGIQFPKDRKGGRSTSAAGQAAFALSVAPVNPLAAAAAFAEKNWRFGYAKHVIANVRACCKSTTACISVARAGLDYLHDNFEFVRGDKTYTMRAAMTELKDTFPGTYVVKGEKPRPSKFDLTVPYRRELYPTTVEPTELKGAELLEQLNKWSDAGTIEPSARDAIAAVSKSPEWLDLSGHYFVLLGAGSAMGPLQILLDHGANIVALDLDRPHIWERLIGMAKKSCGTMILPLKVPNAEATSLEAVYANAGCNLFTQTPEICNWITALEPTKDFTVGGYAYLDGEAHVRVSLAMDAIMAGVAANRKTTTSLAFLCSPTDVFVVQPEARDAAIARYQQPSTVGKLAAVLRKLKKGICTKNAIDLAPSDDGTTQYAINDGLVVPQGPNYALAKRLQHWRAMLSRYNGHPVSTNIAPSTATVSVVHNKQFAMAYGGFRFFEPMEVSFQETSNAVMGALLIHDIRNPKSKSYPKNKLLTDESNPIELFAPGSFHGGIWRGAFKIGSIGEAAALFWVVSSNKIVTLVGASGLVAAVAAAVSAAV